MTKRKREYKLWDKAKSSLEKHYDYICSNPHSKRKKLKEGFINIGLGGIIPDVLGIKDIGNQYEPKLEIIAVEVKENLPNYRQRHMDQVKQASVFAHKVFLAVPREFNSEEVELAVSEGIGLFELNPDTKRLKLIVPSPLFKPAESKIIELMRRLEFFHCCVCNCYWNKNLVDIMGYRPTHVFSQKRRMKFVKFICQICSDKLYNLHSKSLRARFAEEWKFKRLSRKIETLASKTHRFVEKREALNIKKKLAKQADRTERTRRILRESLNKKFGKLNTQVKKVRRRLRTV